jgi:hypothetical protein
VISPLPRARAAQANAFDLREAARDPSLLDPIDDEEYHSLTKQEQVSPVAAPPLLLQLLLFSPLHVCVRARGARARVLVPLAHSWGTGEGG